MALKSFLFEEFSRRVFRSFLYAQQSGRSDWVRVVVNVLWLLHLSRARNSNLSGRPRCFIQQYGSNCYCVEVDRCAPQMRKKQTSHFSSLSPWPADLVIVSSFRHRPSANWISKQHRQRWVRFFRFSSLFVRARSDGSLRSQMSGGRWRRTARRRTPNRRNDNDDTIRNGRTCHHAHHDRDGRRDGRRQ